MDHLVLLENTEQQSITFTVSSSFGGLLKLSSGFESNSMISHTLLSNETLATQPSETITLTLTIFPIKGRFGAEKITLSAIDEYDRSQSSSLMLILPRATGGTESTIFSGLISVPSLKTLSLSIDRNGAIYQFNGQFWKPLPGGI
jgi:5-enolpyruvylshikimate-3-phosphate synthase